MANKTLEEKRLKNFYEDLKDQNKEELTLKKLRSNNYEKAVMREKQVKKQLSKILHKYGFVSSDQFGDSFYVNPSNTKHSAASEYSKESAQNAGENSQVSLDEILFKDVKLDRLWKKAQSIESFSDKQLKLIKEEIRAYEEKLELYHEFVNKLEENKADSKRRHGEEENHIDSDLRARENKFHVIEEMNQKLKEKHKYLKQEYENLVEMVRNMTFNYAYKNEEFEEAAVLQLWKLAEKSDFVGEELVSLKEELRDLQRRIQKLKFFETQLYKDHLDNKQVIGDHDDDQHKSHVQKKVKELGSKIDKIHSDIEARILRRHTEL